MSAAIDPRFAAAHYLEGRDLFQQPAGMKRFDIAQVRSGGVMVESEDGDYVLRSDAQALADALRELMAFCEDSCVIRAQDGGEIVYPAFAQARAALAKATEA